MDEKLNEILCVHERSLQDIEKRYHYLKAILGRIQDVTPTDVFTVRNDVLWSMMMDSYDMLIIDIASFYKGLVKGGGFFGVIQSYSSKLKSPSVKKLMPTKRPRYIGKKPLSEDHKRLIEDDLMCSNALQRKQYFNEAFVFLFGEREGELSASHVDVENLKNKVYDKAQKLIEIRNKSRAHRFEYAQNEAKEDILISEIKELFDELKKTFNAIRLLATDSTVGYHEQCHAIADETVYDLVDIVMNGSIGRVVDRFYDLEQLAKVCNEPMYFHLKRERYYQVNPKPYTFDGDLDDPDHVRKTTKDK